MNNNVQNELYASLGLQITMAQDYSEWLRQETKRNDELLESHSEALSRLNGLMVQSPSEYEKVDSSPSQELPEGLKWEDAPRWADSLMVNFEGDNWFWCNEVKYQYINGGRYMFGLGTLYSGKRDLTLFATRPEGGQLWL